MLPRKLIEFILSSSLVSNLKAEEIAMNFSPRTLEKHSFLLKQGRIADDYFFLENGCMRAFAFDTEDNEITTNFYTANQVVFEVSSFFNRTVSRENIQCLTDCSGWSISYQQLNGLFHALPEFREFGRYILVSGFSSLKTRMLSMITETAEERYEHLVQSKPEIFQQAPLKHIASFLGVTDTSLSRIRREYASKQS